MCPLLVDPEENAVAGGDLLNVHVSAMRAIVDRQNSSVHRSHARHADHRLDWQPYVLIPVHKSILDLNHFGLNPELLSPDPVGKHSDAGPKRSEAELVEFDVEDVDAQHVAHLRSPHLDW